jgi:hypothetical protein
MNEPVIRGGIGVQAAVRSAWTGLWLRLPDDPGLAGLRRAARTALVIPATFAVARLVIGDAQVTLFVAFGCFALLVMADFGGPRRPRAAAYVITTLVQARDRAGEAFDQFLTERGAKPLDPQTGAFLIASGTHAIMVGDLVNVIAEMGYRAAGCSAGITALQAQMQVLLAAFLRLADRLSGATGPAEPQVRVSDDVLHETALTCLQRWRDDPAGGRTAIAVVVATEWIGQLGALAVDLEEPVAAAVEAARVPWWR